jgi:hypothetical protein
MDILGKRSAIPTFFRAFKGHGTPRRCSECPRPAVGWKFKGDQRGGIDKSSKLPICLAHSPKNSTALQASSGD